MATQTKFHITTSNGRQRALWLRLFSSETLPVTAADPHEVFAPDGRSRWVYDLDTVAIGEHGRRRLAAYIASRRWGVTFEQALRDVAFGWTIDATDCELAAVGEFAVQDSPGETLDGIGEITVLENGRTPKRRRNSRQRRAYGRSLLASVPGQINYGL